MFQFTEDMKNVVATAVRPFLFATASKDGKPNGVPIGFVRILSDDEFMLVDNFMQKTQQNIIENPVAAVTCWSNEVHYGYQFKGKARYETSGEVFDSAVEWVQSRGASFQPKGAVIVKVDEVYYVGGRKDSRVNLASQEN
ncbi:MAG TPA: pyridoxamine 5'-phosphate oxidase [Dehalococcoidia bacterium]|nr:pyridoxamine 5'-phosphate oxidase [Dehalococcoidia bacterium]